MTINESVQGQPAGAQEQKVSDKEFNFRQIEKKLQEERDARSREASRRAELEKEIEQLRASASMRNHPAIEEDDDFSEPYVDHKKLNKKLAKVGENTQSEIQKAMEIAKRKAKEELKQEMFLESKPDFYDTIQTHANKLYEVAPELANAILSMPDGFERQKLVYHNIKSLGLDKPAKQESSIQEKINANKKSPYYQSSDISTAPYASAGDFSKSGQEAAYKKMQELKKRLAI